MQIISDSLKTSPFSQLVFKMPFAWQSLIRRWSWAFSLGASSFHMNTIPVKLHITLRQTYLNSLLFYQEMKRKIEKDCFSFIYYSSAVVVWGSRSHAGDVSGWNGGEVIWCWSRRCYIWNFCTLFAFLVHHGFIELFLETFCIFALHIHRRLKVSVYSLRFLRFILQVAVLVVWESYSSKLICSWFRTRLMAFKTNFL